MSKPHIFVSIIFNTILFFFLFGGTANAQTVNLTEYIAGPNFIPHSLSTGETIRFTGEGGPGPGTPARQYKNDNYEQFFIGNGVFRQEDTSWAPLAGFGDALCQDGTKAVYTLRPGCQSFTNGDTVTGDGARWAPATASVGQSWPQETHQIVPIVNKSLPAKQYCELSNLSGYSGTQSCGQAPTLQLVALHDPGQLTFCTGITNQEPVIEISGSGGAGSGDRFFYMKGWGLVGFEAPGFQAGLMGAGADPSGCQGASSAPIADDGEHSCTSFCQGTTFNPCKFTPGNECSFPFKDDQFLSLQTNLTPEELTNQHTYLLEYLQQHAATNRGIRFLLDAKENDTAACTPQGIAALPTAQQGPQRDRCNQLQGGARLTPSLAENSNSIAPNPDDNAFLNQEAYYRGYLDNPTGSIDNFFTFGTLQRLLDRTTVWQIMSALQKLKSSCYDLGRVFPWMDSPLFGKVRCANYVHFNCPSCGVLATERDVFTGPLFPCVVDPGKKACIDAYNSLPTIVRQKVDDLSALPIAKFPIIGAVEKLITEKEKPVSAQDNQYIPAISKFKCFLDFGPFTQDCTDLITDPNNPTINQDITTGYYFYTLITSQANQLAAKITHNTLNPLEVVNQVNSQTTETTPISTDYDPNKPFYVTHVDADHGLDPTDGDDRFRWINKFLNVRVDQCLQQPEDTDKTPNQTPIQPRGRLIDLALNVVAAAAKVADLFEQLLLEDIDVQEFINCEIFPSGLKDSDKYAINTGAQFFPLANQKKHVTDVAKRDVEYDTGLTGSGRLEWTGTVPACHTTPEDHLLYLLQLPGATRPCCSAYPDDDFCIQDQITVTSIDHKAKIENRQFGSNDGLAQTRETSTEGGNIIETFMTTFGADGLWNVNQKVAKEQLQPLQTSNTCDKWWFWFGAPGSATGQNQCLPLPGSISNTNVPQSCFYRTQTTTIPTQSDLLNLICQASQRHNVPGFLIRAIFSIEGGPAVAAFNNNRFGETVACPISGTGDVGPMQINVPACRPGATGNPINNADLCSFEGAINIAASILSSKANIAQQQYGVTRPASKTAWSYDLTYRTAGLYNGNPGCQANPGTGPKLAGACLEGVGCDITYCKFGAEAHDQPGGEWFCPGDPNIGSAPPGYQR